LSKSYNCHRIQIDRREVKSKIIAERRQGKFMAITTNYPRAREALFLLIIN